MTLPRLSVVQSADSHRKTATTVNALMASSADAMSVASRAQLASAPISSSVLFDGSVWTFDSSDLSALVTVDTRQGIYVAPSSDTSGASGAWVRQFDAAVHAIWFGVTANGTTDDSAAILAADAFLRAIAVNGTTAKGSAKLLLPAGSINMAATPWEPHHTYIVEGAGSGQVGGIATQLVWNGSCGIRPRRNNTTGDRAIGGPTSEADGFTLRAVMLRGSYSGGATSTSFHAFDPNCRFTCEDVSVYDWGGNGFNIVATSTGGAGIEGNANCFAINRCSAYGCQHGIYVSGADANAATIIGTDTSNNRGFGVFDECFLGNTYVGHHASGNTSGAYKTTNANALHVFTGCYSESGQPASSFSQLSLILGGQHAAGVVGGCYLAINTDGRLTKWGEMELKADASTITENGTALTLNSWATTASVIFKYQSTEYGDVSGINGTGIQYSVNSGLKHNFYSGASGYDATIGSAGIDLPNTGRAYSIQGFQVVGPRAATLPADASDLASAITLVNAIKAGLKATTGHGLFSG